MQVDKPSLDALHDSAEVHLQSLEPWVQVCTLFVKMLCISCINTKTIKRKNVESHR